MLKKRGNKKEGYHIDRTYTKGHQKITEPILTKSEQILMFDDLEMLSDSAALGTIAEEKFVIYEVNDGESYSMLSKVVEFTGFNSYEKFIIGVDVLLKEYVIFRRTSEHSLEKLKVRVRNKQFITGKDIMLFMCDNKLKILNFDCEKLTVSGNLAFLRGTYANIRSNWVLDVTTGVLYKTTTSFSFESLVSMDLVMPYILFETTEGNAFAVMKNEESPGVINTDVILYDGEIRFKEYYFESVTKKGLIYSYKGREYLNLDGITCTEGFVLTINKKRYRLKVDFELELITNEIIAKANKSLQKTLGVSIAIEQNSYYVDEGVLYSRQPLKSMGNVIKCDLFDNVKSSKDCEVEFLLKDYLLQKYHLVFEKHDFTKMFDTPNMKTGDAQNGFSDNTRNYQLNIHRPRQFEDFLVFEELSLHKTLIVNRTKIDVAQKSDLEFVMPVNSILLGVGGDSLCVEIGNLQLLCDYVKFTPNGLMVMGKTYTGYSTFLIKDNGSINPITEDKFVTAEYYVAYDASSWKTAYSKSLPSLFNARKKLEKLNAF